MILESGQFHRARSAVERKRLEKIRAMDKQEFLNSEGKEDYIPSFDALVTDYVTDSIGREEPVDLFEKELKDLDDKD